MYTIYLKWGVALKKVSVVIRVLLALMFLGLAIWFILPMRVRIFDIANILGLMIAVCGLIITLAWNKFKQLWKAISKNKFGRYALRVLTVLLILAFSYVAVISVFIINAANKTPANDSTVIVLGCKVNGKSPSLMLSKRLEAAFEYLNEHENAICIVSGGQGYNEGISEAECMYNYLTEHGISKERIILEDKSSTTSENLEFSKKIIEERGLSKNIAIATDGFHEFRASILAKKVGLNPTGAVSADTPLYLLGTYHFRETIAIANELIFG